MQTWTLVLAFAAPALIAGCKTTDCGDGTTEQDGTCVPANTAYGSAACGPFTVLQGGQCQPMFPPTVCGDRTLPDTDMSTGVTTCIGTGGAAGCSAKLACPAPAAGKQTICGQLYDFETGAAFQATNATGAACTAGATSGPCALALHAFDAVMFSSAPTTTAPQATGSVYLDDCGRYKLIDIAVPTTPFVLVAVDDAAPGMAGPAGVTNATGVATPSAPNTAVKDFEAFIVKSSTTTGWGAAPSLAAGIYAAVYRGHKTGTEPAVGVSLQIGAAANPGNPFVTDGARDYYFQTGSPNRTALDPTANATTTNGTALLSGANLGELYSGAGAGIPTLQCVWEVHAGAAVPGSVFIQIFRPTNAPGQTCPL